MLSNSSGVMVGSGAGITGQELSAEGLGEENDGVEIGSLVSSKSESSGKSILTQREQPESNTSTRQSATANIAFFMVPFLSRGSQFPGVSHYSIRVSVHIVVFDVINGKQLPLSPFPMRSSMPFRLTSIGQVSVKWFNPSVSLPLLDSRSRVSSILLGHPQLFQWTRNHSKTLRSNRCSHTSIPNPPYRLFHHRDKIPK